MTGDINVTINRAYLAEGGVITSPTALIGDGGSEWVIALGRQALRPPTIDLPAPEVIASIRQCTQNAVRPQMRTGSPDLRIENATSAETADVWIYDRIGSGMFGDGVAADEFAQEFRAITAPNITVHINSPGGDVFDGLAIYNAIRSHPSDITTRIEGIAASAASFIAMAGDRVLMAPHSTMMIHEASGLCLGPAADMRAEAEVLDKLSNNIASIYAEHASGPRGGTRGDTAMWRTRMLAESWYTDEEAVSAGLADGIDREAPTAANTFDLSHFRNAPAELLNATAEAQITTEPTIRDAEQALRDAGFSRRVAQTILADGFPSLTLRDAGEETDEPTEEAAVPSGEDVIPEHPRALARNRLRLLKLSLSA